MELKPETGDAAVIDAKSINRTSVELKRGIYRTVKRIHWGINRTSVELKLRRILWGPARTSKY